MVTKEISIFSDSHRKYCYIEENMQQSPMELELEEEKDGGSGSGRHAREFQFLIDQRLDRCLNLKTKTKL